MYTLLCSRLFSPGFQIGARANHNSFSISHPCLLPSKVIYLVHVGLKQIELDQSETKFALVFPTNQLELNFSKIGSKHN